VPPPAPDPMITTSWTVEEDACAMMQESYTSDRHVDT
jgi:hypothetical protein